MTIFTCQHPDCVQSVFYSNGCKGYDPKTPEEKGWFKLGKHKYLCPKHKPVEQPRVQQILSL